MEELVHAPRGEAIAVPAQHAEAEDAAGPRLRSVSGRDRWLAPLIVAAGLLAWETGARAGLISELFFPAPSIVLRTLLRMVENGSILTATSLTLTRLLVGLALGGTVGLLLGLAMGWSSRLRTVVDPLIAAAHPIPKTALFPLILILFGIGESSKIVLIALAAFFPMVISTMAGVRQIHPIHFEVAQNYGASRALVLRRVVLPGSLPQVLAGARLALNTSLVITITVELLTAREGLGATIWLAWETLRTEQLYAALLVIAALGITFSFLLHRLARRVSPWQTDDAG